MVLTDKNATRRVYAVSEAALQPNTARRQASNDERLEAGDASRCARVERI